MKGVPPIPAGAAPDVAAAWAAMCPPVRQRYAAESQSNKARVLALRWLRWEVGRRQARRATEGGVTGAGRVPVDARILVIQPDHLGGALLTTPALSLIKRALPTAHLTVLAGPWADDVPAHCPAVDRVRVCRFPGFDRSPAAGGAFGQLGQRLAPYSMLLQTASMVEADRYDVAINLLPHFWWGAAVSALAGTPHRLGYASAESDGFLTRTLPPPSVPVGAAGRATPRAHAAELSLALAREALVLAGRAHPDGFDGRMAYEPAAEERAEAWRLWRANDLDEASAVIVVHPAPGAAVKRWAAPLFARVADHLAGHYGVRIVVTGTAAELAECRELAAACWHKPVVLAGQTSFGVLAALLDRCRLAIGTDNGAMHLATARGVPVLRLFGPTDPATWDAWTGGASATVPSLNVPSLNVPSLDVPSLNVSATLACAPCHRLDVPPWSDVVPGEEVYPCMRDVTVDRVIAAAEMLWSRERSRG